MNVGADLLSRQNQNSTPTQSVKSGEDFMELRRTSLLLRQYNLPSTFLGVPSPPWSGRYGLCVAQTASPYISLDCPAHGSPGQGLSAGFLPLTRGTPLADQNIVLRSWRLILCIGQRRDTVRLRLLSLLYFWCICQQRFYYYNWFTIYCTIIIVIGNNLLYLFSLGCFLGSCPNLWEISSRLLQHRPCKFY